MKKVIWTAIIIGILTMGSCFAGGIWYVQQLFSPVDRADNSEIRYIVERGESLSSVAADLEAQGIAKSADGLKLYARMFGVGGNIQAGEHILHRSDDADNIIATLETPPAQVTITILPGWRREEIATYLSEQKLAEFDEEEFLELTTDLEGQLMPETYKIAPFSDTQQIVDILHEEFEREVTDDPDFQEKLEKSGKSFMEILTIASLLQREARDSEQMRVIAGIINNRLDDHYPLQLCASAQYATGQDKKTGKWWEAPTLADTQYDSPYNTYVYKDLPPGPICSVSLGAIEAALDPAATDYYYYLHDDAGVIHYAKTQEQHNRNRELYL